MATYEKISLSGSPQGTGIYISTGAASAVHATGTSSSVMDEVWIYIVCYGNFSTTVELLINGNGIVQREMSKTDGIVLVIPGFIFKGSGTTPVTISVGRSDTSSDIHVFGYVNRITP